jgi:2-polyprenyl-6-methoxyphenol hydroxylase-like FAD-dependent oxidoreductase
VRTAVVSGLGPNGMLAALVLHRAGYAVTAVEQRMRYARSIHLSLRRSYFDDVCDLDGELAARLSSIATPIAEMQHVRDRGGCREVTVAAPQASSRPAAATVAARLLASPTVHVRLDELERAFAEHLETFIGIRVLRGMRFALERQPDDRFRARCTPATTDGATCAAVADVLIDDADLIVIAEGGKSTTASLLSRSPLKLSSPKLYISVHVDHAIGSLTRRLDTEVPVVGALAPVSFWATGHGQRERGTWLVLEVPRAVHGDRPTSTFDRGYFDRAAMAVLGLDVPPPPTERAFAGTFRFEQQLLATPYATPHVVFFGDAAGMGHHALGTGLELGACDAAALRELAYAIRSSSSLLSPRTHAAVVHYGEEVLRSRVALLAFGLREYYPDIDDDPSRAIAEAVEAARAHPGHDPRGDIERWLVARPRRQVADRSLSPAR